MVLSVYVEQICSTVVEIDLKKLDIGPPSIMPVDNSAPNNDEKSTEIKVNIVKIYLNVIKKFFYF